MAAKRRQTVLQRGTLRERRREKKSKAFEIGIREYAKSAQKGIKSESVTILSLLSFFGLCRVCHSAVELSTAARRLADDCHREQGS